MSSGDDDAWSRWLREQRFPGGEREERIVRELRGFRDRILDGADLHQGDVVFDVGSGDGFVGFGALERVGPSGTVIFSDVSEPLLADARATAADLGVLDRCEFVTARAEDLAPIDDASVDAVTLRSVLIYLEGVGPAFAAFERVLRDGGRLSLCEPVNSFLEAMEGPSVPFMGFDAARVDPDVEPRPDLAEAVQGYISEHAPSYYPATSFEAGDLFETAEAAGFGDLHLDLSAWSTTRRETADWESYLETSYGPGVPTIGEAIEAALADEEREAFVGALRPLVESRAPRDDRGAIAFLRGRKRA